MRGELTPLLAFLVAVVALAARCRRRCSDDAVGEAPGGVPIHETFEPSGDTRNTGVPSASAIATTSAAPPGPRACSPSQTATSTSQCPASPRAFRWRLAWVSPADLGDDELATVRLARGDHGPELRSDAVRPAGRGRWRPSRTPTSSSSGTRAASRRGWISPPPRSSSAELGSSGSATEPVRDRPSYLGQRSRPMPCFLRTPAAVAGLPGLVVGEARTTPAASAPREGSPLGDNVHHGRRRSVAIADEDRLRRTYVVGQTGTGKSTLLLNMLMRDIEAGHGVALLDPHGSLAAYVLCRIPEHRRDDVFFDVTDIERPLPFNVLELREPDPVRYRLAPARAPGQGVGRARPRAGAVREDGPAGDGRPLACRNGWLRHVQVSALHRRRGAAKYHVPAGHPRRAGDGRRGQGGDLLPG